MDRLVQHHQEVEQADESETVLHISGYGSSAIISIKSEQSQEVQRRMDALTHMLTDPLDPKEEPVGHITEECTLGNCRVNLPEDLLEDPDIFFSVVSESTWSEVLSDSQREHLRQFLPQFPENNAGEQESTISDLFNNGNFNFGNPLHLAQKLFRDGFFHPEVVKYRQLCAKSQKKRQLYSLQQYYHRLVKQILVSRKELLEFAVHNGLDFPPKRKLLSKTHAEIREQRVRKRLSRILKEVKTECGDSNASSDDDDVSLWTQTPQSPSSPTPTVSLKILPSLSTQDMKSTDKIELGEQDLRIMLQNHREKRKRLPLEDKVQAWQASPASSLNVWFSSVPCWSDLVVQALQFLAGETKDGMMALPSGFSPFVEFSDEAQQWRWIGPTQDAEKDVSALCQLWLDSRDLIVKVASLKCTFIST
ncbi:hypothetical protein fugu_009084 [Takifugu bimaculatus]|uniref:DEUBAD domain-containing protein n=1 Tax=Takifugu bimaculatus TaxID=433685 RepID=A0A4Z2AZL6_9TELE|nr:hypothetical protein fugu_009084 [Takifugu bimaculatus]